jgi:hypothetical protein
MEYAAAIEVMAGKSGRSAFCNLEDPATITQLTVAIVTSIGEVTARKHSEL